MTRKGVGTHLGSARLVHGGGKDDIDQDESAHELEQEGLRVVGRGRQAGS